MASSEMEIDRKSWIYKDGKTFNCTSGSESVSVPSDAKEVLVEIAISSITYAQSVYVRKGGSSFDRIWNGTAQYASFRIQYSGTTVSLTGAGASSNTYSFKADVYYR